MVGQRPQGSSRRISFRATSTGSGWTSQVEHGDVFACEHHLLERLRRAQGDNPPRWPRPLDASPRRRSPAVKKSWEEFLTATNRLGASAARTVPQRCQAPAADIGADLLPAHRSTAGAETAAHRLRNLYEQRSVSLRNANRTNLLLSLTLLHLNNRDDVNAYHRILRPLLNKRRATLNRTAAQPGCPPRVRRPPAIPTLSPSEGR